MNGLSLDQVLAQLNDIQRDLDQLPEDAFSERQQLGQRRRLLRIRARELQAERRTPEQLRRELAHLVRTRDEIKDRQLSVGHIGGGGGPGGGGIEIQYVREFNRILGEGWGLPEIEDRIHRLELELAAIERPD